MISIVIPLYNKELSVKRTLDSVLTQSFKDFEILIVNDGSTDNSLQVVQAIDDSRIKIIKKENGGVSSARNVGIKSSKFDYIAFLDADDIWGNDYLASMVNLILGHPEAGAYAANFYYSYPDSTQRKSNESLVTGYIHDYFKEVLKGAIVHTSSVIIKKNIMEQAGFFDERISRGEDIDVWSRVARLSPIAYLSDAKNLYIMGAENSSGTKVPAPNKSYAYYLDCSLCINCYDLKYTKRILFRRMLNYLSYEWNLLYFFRIFKKQRNQIFKTYIEN